MLNENVIFQQTSPPYISDLNGVAERFPSLFIAPLTSHLIRGWTRSSQLLPPVGRRCARSLLLLPSSIRPLHSAFRLCGNVLSEAPACPLLSSTGATAAASYIALPGGPSIMDDVDPGYIQYSTEKE